MIITAIIIIIALLPFFTSFTVEQQSAVSPSSYSGNSAAFTGYNTHCVFLYIIRACICGQLPPSSSGPLPDLENVRFHASIFAVPRTALFRTEISDIVPRIYWNQSTSSSYHWDHGCSFLLHL